MIKVIKHGNTVHTYKCSRCSCIFIADKEETEINGIEVCLRCPECGYYVLDHDIIDNQEIIKDKLFEKVNVPSCWKVGDVYYNFPVTCASTTTDECNKRFEQ